MNGTPSLKRAYNLGLKAVPNFESLSLEVIEYYERHLDEIPAALKRGFILEQAIHRLSISVVKVFNLGATKGKKTAECFVDGWFYRDDDFDRWLGKKQPDASACVVSVCAVGTDWILAEAARALPGVEQTEDTISLGNSIVACGYAFESLAQGEDIAERAKRGEDIGLRSDRRYGNLFFVETSNPKEPVLVGNVYRSNRDWFARAYRLGCDIYWDTDNQFLVPNLDASKLAA